MIPDLLPCGTAVAWMVAAGAAGYLLGRWREQLYLLEVLRPEGP